MLKLLKFKRKKKVFPENEIKVHIWENKTIVSTVIVGKPNSVKIYKKN